MPNYVAQLIWRRPQELGVVGPQGMWNPKFTRVIWRLDQFEELDLSECKSLTMLPNSFGGLKSLQSLDLKGCGIQSLEESFGDLTNL